MHTRGRGEKQRRSKPAMTTKPSERLGKTLARVAREHGLDQERLRRWVSEAIQYEEHAT
jgi:transposase-like protein